MPPAAPRLRRLPSRRSLRRFAVLLCLPALLSALILYANLTPTHLASKVTFSKPSEIPNNLVALVFGTTDRVQGHENRYFTYRIEAASKLWHLGKIRGILVSGDNRSPFYNEPEKMRQALIARGVPADRIICDYAGLRTLDSVVRAKEIFGLQEVLFVSQPFQNERALYIAQARGIRAWAFNARDVTHAAGIKTRLREVGARVKMWLDLHCLNTQPKHLGPKIPLQLAD